MSDLTMEFARRDDCLDRMVPSDLRMLIGERDALAADNKRLREALEVVARWDLPATGQKWASGGEMSYGACFGSNGEREYIKSIALDALASK